MSLEPEGELFELELLGGATERRYRKLRPEVEAMPWGTMDLSQQRPEEMLRARQQWTLAAYQEHRTGVACAATLRALIEARAPIDLVGIATRFPLDEMVHVELCSRMAMECGGGTEIRYDPTEVILDADPSLSTLLRACELATRFFSVGEAISIPLLRATWHAARHDLPRSVLARIVKDEAAHGVFGFTVLDWAADRLTHKDRLHLGAMADLGIDYLELQWAGLCGRPNEAEHDGDVLQWMKTDEYLALARKSLQRDVIEPLRRRGIPLKTRG